MENRVFSVELENPGDDSRTAVRKQVIAKFYRPGRWQADEILSEHLMQLVLSEEDIPTPKFLPVENSRFVTRGNVPFQERLESNVTSHLSEVTTLGKTGEFFFCVWEKIAGRSPLELTGAHLQEIGATVARMHNLFESHIRRENFNRHALSTEYFCERALKNLKTWGRVPRPIDTQLFNLVEDLTRRLEWVNNCVDFIPTHGDLHRLNLLQTRDEGSFWVVDFDDCMWAPDVQDLWLIASGAGVVCEEGVDPTLVALQALVEGYERYRRLPDGSEILVEPLRTFRLVYYMGWIAGRWKDPLFRDVFSFFDEPSYWERSVADLEKQRQTLFSQGLLG